MNHKRLLPPPTAALIEAAGIEFDGDPGTELTERTLAKVWARFPENVEVEDVLAKAAALNQLYSTRISTGDLEALARHIVRLRIDPLVEKGEPSVGDRIINCEDIPPGISLSPANT